MGLSPLHDCLKWPWTQSPGGVRQSNKVTPHRRGVLFSLHKMLAASANKNKNRKEQQRNARLGHCAELALYGLNLVFVVRSKETGSKIENFWGVPDTQAPRSKTLGCFRHRISFYKNLKLSFIFSPIKSCAHSCM